MDEEQEGIVAELIGDGMARVAVEEGAGCGSCILPCGHASSNCNSVLAENRAGARPGDRVVLRSRAGRKWSAIGYLLFFPLVLFWAGFALGHHLFPRADGLAALVALAVAGVYFVCLGAVEKRRRKKRDGEVWIDSIRRD